MRNEPTTLSIRQEIPFDFKVKIKIDARETCDYEFLEDNGMWDENVLLFSMANSCVSVYHYDENDEIWEHEQSFAISEKSCGLSFWHRNGWTSFPNDVQKAYMDFIAEGALLGEKPKKVKAKK